MKDLGVLPGERICAVCERSLIDTAYACLRPTCVLEKSAAPGLSFVQRGMWFCREHYRLHLDAAHTMGNLEVLQYLDPEKWRE